MADDDLVERLTALGRAYRLKDERRTGWELRGVTDPETVAGHTWGVAYLCLCFGDPDSIGPEDGPVDLDRAVRMAVVHDLAESIVGDVATRAHPDDQSVPPAEKRDAERRAIRPLLDGFRPELVDLWEEYEARASPEARFVKDMDLIDMCLQAWYYERERRYEPGSSDHFDRFEALDEFFTTAEPRLETSLGRTLFAEIEARYREARDRSV